MDSFIGVVGIILVVFVLYHVIKTHNATGKAYQNRARNQRNRVLSTEPQRVPTAKAIEPSPLLGQTSVENKADRLPGAPTSAPPKLSPIAREEQSILHLQTNEQKPATDSGKPPSITADAEKARAPLHFESHSIVDDVIREVRHLENEPDAEGLVTISISHSHSEQPSKNKKPARWITSDETLSIGGKTISGAYLYHGGLLSAVGRYGIEASLLDD